MMQISIKVLMVLAVLVGTIMALPFMGNNLPPQRMAEYASCKQRCGNSMTMCDLRCNYHMGYLRGLSTLKCQRDCAQKYWRCYVNCSYR